MSARVESEANGLPLTMVADELSRHNLRDARPRAREHGFALPHGVDGIAADEGEGTPTLYRSRARTFLRRFEVVDPDPDFKRAADVVNGP